MVLRLPHAFVEPARFLPLAVAVLRSCHVGLADRQPRLHDPIGSLLDLLALVEFELRYFGLLLPRGGLFDFYVILNDSVDSSVLMDALGRLGGYLRQRELRVAVKAFRS